MRRNLTGVLMILLGVVLLARVVTFSTPTPAWAFGALILGVALLLGGRYLLPNPHGE